MPTFERAEHAAAWACGVLRAGPENGDALNLRTAEEWRSSRIPRERLAVVVGEKMALSCLAVAHARQRALDSGDLIPSHFSGRSPA